MGGERNGQGLAGGAEPGPGEAPGVEPGALSVGGVFHGRYRIERAIRAGGMGAVYEVLDERTDKHRALKLMLPSVVANADLRARFTLEAKVAAQIESEHIVEVLDTGVDPTTGAPFIVMELLRGEDLAHRLEARGRLAPHEVVVLLGQVALALDKTHAAGIVHRDLKPENLFITTRDDGSPRLKILDFGIAKIVAQSGQAAKQTTTIGTPLYMSPEQIHGDGSIGPRADLWALAHIAYALLAGEPYWSDEARAVSAVVAFLMRILQGAPEAPTVRAARRGVFLPPAFDSWFARGTAIAPQHRFESASMLVGTLSQVLGVGAPRQSMPEAAPPSAVRTPSGPSPTPTAAWPQPGRQPDTGGGGTKVSGPQATPGDASGGASDGRAYVAMAIGTAPGASTTHPVSSDPIPGVPTRSTKPAVFGAAAVLVIAAAGLMAFRWTRGTSSAAAPDANAPGLALSVPWASPLELASSSAPPAVPPAVPPAEPMVEPAASASTEPASSAALAAKPSRSLPSPATGAAKPAPAPTAPKTTARGSHTLD